MLGFATARFAFVALSSAAMIPATDFFVDSSAPNCGSGTGASGDPVCSVTAAMALASPGDTIRIAPGTYVENLVIADDLDLIGTGGATVTILDGAQAGSVVTIPVATTVRIDGLTITRGVALNGGGISVDGTLVLENSVVSSNSAERGGGIWGNFGAPMISIENCTISDNSAYSYGTGFASGGGVDQRGGDLTIVNSTIADNTCFASGRCPILTCGSYSGSGGGLNAFGTNLTLVDSTISGNRAGAVGYYSGGSGGGLNVSSSLVTLSNSTLSDNTADSGGGARFFGVLAGSALSNMTITDNVAFGVYYNTPVDGGVSVAFAPVSIRNSVIADNNGGDVDGTVISLGNNLIGTGAIGVTDGVNEDLAGTTATPLSAMLSLLQFNGGSTKTHAPQVGSPAIDAGSAIVFAPIDQRGLARPTGLRSDIGSVEFDGRFEDSCNGDGGDQLGCTNCPCGNNAPQGTTGGCLNSFLTSARLNASGDRSLSLPAGSVTDLRFDVTDAPPTSFCRLISGAALAPGNPANPCFSLKSGVQSMFFDGLRCGITNLVRHGGRSADMNGEAGANGDPWGGEGDPNNGLGQAAGFAVGQTRYFQVIARDFPDLSCMTGLNTTQAIKVTFEP